MDDKDQSRCSGPVKFWLGFGLLLLASAAVIVICVVVVPEIKSNYGMNKTENATVAPRILEAIPTLEEVRAVKERLVFGRKDFLHFLLIKWFLLSQVEQRTHKIQSLWSQ